ncbi:GNAT family N-acetyltransferase [Candidatus Bipolaricaulota bacterium]
MPMRAFRVPADLLPLIDMFKQTFHYPDHPEWSLRTDELEHVVRELRSLRRLWPVLRVLQIFSPSLRDMFRGFVWEEDGRIAAAVIVQRQGTTALWSIGMVAVLPEHRRRGLARKLLSRALDDLRGRGCEKVILGVIDGNVPAYSLYTSLGFEHYAGTIEFETTPSMPPTVPARPSGYTQESVKRTKLWPFQFELEKRITPPEVARFQPVDVGRFRPAPLLRLFLPLINLAQRREVKLVLLRRAEDGKLVAWGAYSVPRTSGGLNQMGVQVDPDHAELADHLVAYHLERAVARGSGRRVDFFIPDWMPVLVESAERHGFTKRIHYHSLGLVLSSR